MNDRPEEFEFLRENIQDTCNIFDDSNVFTGIYCWKIDKVPYYIGQSVDTLSRCDHMYEIWNSPKYWLDIKDNFEHHSLSVEVIEKCDKENLNEKEFYWISKLKPISQKCNGTDHIKPLDERNDQVVVSEIA